MPRRGSDEDNSADDMYRQLRHMAASDPRTARERLVELLNGDSPHLRQLLDLMTPPSEGRLRQLVANTAGAVRENKQLRDRLVPHLLQWQRFESDEFAKPAINAALRGVDPTAYTNGSVSSGDVAAGIDVGDPLFSDQDIEVYRWVAGRLCHRVRNHLELPAAYLADAIHGAAAIEDDAVRAGITQTLIEAQQAFRQIARIVDFNIGDEHFIWRAVAIIPWLRRMTETYRSKHEPIRLEVTGEMNEPGPSIMATDLLLEVVFWNLWRNAAQEANGACVVKVKVSVRDKKVCLLLGDDGPGFQASQVSEAFKLRLSTRGEDRGRGLLEVADAVQRLQGTARIVPIGNEYRIELSFPIA